MSFRDHPLMALQGGRSGSVHPPRSVPMGVVVGLSTESSEAGPRNVASRAKEAFRSHSLQSINGLRDSS